MIDQYFGPPLSTTSHTQGKAAWIERTYANTGLRRVLADLPADAELKVIFVDDRAQWVQLNPRPDTAAFDPDDQVWLAFQYDRVAAAQFFQYVFGDRPTRYTPVPGFEGGGHEGFLNHAVCLEAGIQTTYTEYWWGAVGDIRLSDNPACGVE